MTPRVRILFVPDERQARGAAAAISEPALLEVMLFHTTLVVPVLLEVDSIDLLRRGPQRVKTWAVDPDGAASPGPLIDELARQPLIGFVVRLERAARSAIGTGYARES